MEMSRAVHVGEREAGGRAGERGRSELLEVVVLELLPGDDVAGLLQQGLHVVGRGRVPGRARLARAAVGVGDGLEGLHVLQHALDRDGLGQCARIGDRSGAGDLRTGDRADRQRRSEGCGQTSDRHHSPLRMVAAPPSAALAGHLSAQLPQQEAVRAGSPSCGARAPAEASADRRDAHRRLGDGMHIAFLDGARGARRSRRGSRVVIFQAPSAANITGFSSEEA